MTPVTTTVPTEPMTAEDFFEWVNQPSNRDRHFELVRGKVVEMTHPDARPGERHGFVCNSVGRILGNYAYPCRQEYVCSNDTGLLLDRDPDTVRGPDLVLYTTTRRFDDLKVRYSAEPPTLAIEVISPTDRWPAVIRRVAEFLKRGVKLVWVVDPESRTVISHRADQLPQVFDAAEELTCEELPEFKCRTGEFFYLPGEETQP